MARYQDDQASDLNDRLDALAVQVWTCGRVDGCYLEAMTCQAIRSGAIVPVLSRGDMSGGAVAPVLCHCSSVPVLLRCSGAVVPVMQADVSSERLFTCSGE